jgi:redox-sensitive bicupin YhaK (pirin superfamily)
MSTTRTQAAGGEQPAAGAPPRRVVAVADSHVVMEGAGVPVRRVLPSRVATYDLVDPFLLLDDFQMEVDPQSPAFPPHPHRGFEIITYLLEGAASHSDSEGNTAVVSAGGLQRITAGRGIWHGEGPGGQAPGRVRGLQLWINLARAEKQIAPSYQTVEADQIPVRRIGDATVRVLVGEGSPTTLRTPAIYYDVQLPPGGRATLPIPEGYQGFAYVLEGEAILGSNEATVRAGQLAVLGEGGPLSAAGGAGGARFVLGAGRPHREPVRWYGPFVD